MSETQKPQISRQYEGPANVYSDEYDARMANDGDPHFTSEYGERGVGWDFDTATHRSENELEFFGNQVDRRVAREARANQALHGTLQTDTGEPVTSRQLDAMTRTGRPPRGTLIIYPDGKVHQDEKYSK